LDSLIDFTAEVGNKGIGKHFLLFDGELQHFFQQL